MRTITLEDKENASPQLAQTLETSLPAKTTNPMAAKPTASPLVIAAAEDVERTLADCIRQTRAPGRVLPTAFACVVCAVA
jgi:hypothetical protein